MATILLVEDAPDLGLFEVALLEAAGHRVIRCSGGPTPFAACPMIRGDACPFADAAQLIIFSCGLVAPIAHRSYRGEHLLRAYRSHVVYGRLPMLVVSVGKPTGVLEGTGPLAFVDKFSSPGAVVGAVGELLRLTPAFAR
jgi:hypothetical protein